MRFDATPSMPEHPEARRGPNTDPRLPTANCGDCPHRRSPLAVGRCRPGDTCVKAMSGRQIERFFRTKPGLAQDYAGDAFWERRALAARLADSVGETLASGAER